VSDPAQVEAVVSAVERDLGNPSVVIHKLLAEHSVRRDNQDENPYCLIRRCSQTWMPLPH
jgi:hypothetical protein